MYANAGAAEIREGMELLMLKTRRKGFAGDDSKSATTTIYVSARLRQL